MRRPEDAVGKGGWPTIRYFTNETGLEGGTYVKKTMMSMCEELGDQGRMMDYIEDISHVYLCDIMDGEGCTDQELEYIEQMKGESVAELEEQMVRLQGLQDLKVKPKLKTWMRQKIQVLQQLIRASAWMEL